MNPIPDSFAQTIVEVHGSQGTEWLSGLPDLISDCARRWSLEVGSHFEALSYNYVAPAIRTDGTHVVLKLGVPNHEFLSEMEALRFYNGSGSVRLLAGDPDRGVMLLERLMPGEMLSTVEDDERATSIAADVMRKLWKPAPAEHSFITVERWALGMERLRAEFEGGPGPFRPSTVGRADTLFTELIDSMGERVVLHGDLHHYNILSAGDGTWLAIDPKGVVGEREYEIGALLRNPGAWPMDQPYPEQALNRRLDQLADELSLDRSRLANWTFAQAVLSAWWSYEDHGHIPEPAIAYAEVLADMV